MKTLSGFISGYQANFPDGDVILRVYTQSGFRGFNIPCICVMQDNGQMTVFVQGMPVAVERVEKILT
jgi:hypothetical protein